MATKYLGATFDIHGGGMDLVFPHHENELAQSRAAGDAFARYWLHNALLGVAGEKMSKSLGNSLLASEMLTTVRPAELRYYLVQAHYRSVLEYSPESLNEAAAAYRRVEDFVERAAELLGDITDVMGTAPPGAAATAERSTATLPAAFTAALDDDLGVPSALAALHEAVHEGNSALARGDLDAARVALTGVRSMLDVLGLDPLTAPWAQRSGTDGRLRGVVDALVASTLAQRAAARARGDYAAADTLRDELDKAGIVVEDRPDGPHWKLRR